MVMIAEDIAALRAVVDAGDDTALLPLADALEEAGRDEEAIRLRLIASSGKRPDGVEWHGPLTGWTRGGKAGNEPAHAINPGDLKNLLPGNTAWHDNTGLYCVSFPTRSAAYLALAAALISE